jgi:hypothetical protein
MGKSISFLLQCMYNFGKYRMQKRIRRIFLRWLNLRVRMEGGGGGGGSLPCFSTGNECLNARNNQVIKTYLDLCGPRPV